jgi:pimeloyl-ACP methyl ester carboxylesterase
MWKADAMGEGDGSGSARTALDALEVLAVQEAEVSDSLDHVEAFTLGGLLTLLWHGRGRSDQAVLMMGGAMGGLLGPANGLYHELGEQFAAEGIATIRIGYRKPNDLDRCVHDVIATAELAARGGTDHFVLVGHSFGGAVAVRAGIALQAYAAGVVTLATQSAGCEIAEQLRPVPFRLFHGDRDELLPVAASEVVASLGGGDLRVLPGNGHLLAEAGIELRAELAEWIPARLAAHELELDQTAEMQLDQIAETQLDQIAETQLDQIAEET